MGKSSFELKIKKKSCVHIRVERQGYVAKEKTLCHTKNAKPLTRIHFQLEKLKNQISVTSLPHAKIFVDGKYVSEQAVKITVKKDQCVFMSIKKPGFVTAERSYCFNETTALPKSEYIKLEKDEAVESSFSTDYANQEFELKTAHTGENTWFILSQIIANYYDVLEVMDRNTGYLRTAWITKNFNSGTARTRVIIKLGNHKPLTYKVKIISEYSHIPNLSVKKDDAFKEWDRVLRVYQPMISELQTRLRANPFARN